MDNIYHDYWEQELMYQFITEDKCRKKAYVCSPYSAENNEGMLQNMRTARAYMFYALKKMGMCARAPHAFLPMLLCDSVPSERAIALKFGIELLERSDVLLVCSNRISNGMKSEIANAAMLRMPIIVFDEILKFLYVDDLTVGEIAKRLNCSPQYVSDQKQKSLKHLRKRMAEGGDENG